MAQNQNLDELKKNCDNVASILKALSHPQRLLILCFLSEGELTVTELQNMCTLSQSYVSQFLNRMKREGLVDSRREANFVYYFIANEKVTQLIKSLNSIFCC
ncbi:MAG: winged helix-turn-helix transcriptional regulator [Bdellovibrionales bacterium]|nr:winged helix-turn-helix transcriptional regulator [Bdellovibrionales bacterium]